MKKAVLVLVLATALAGGVFAQELWGGKKMFASVELGLLEGGARFEYLLMPNLSVGVNFYWNSLFFFWNELEAGVFARYYVWDGLFGELGLGFHTHTGTETFTYTNEYGGSVTADWFITRSGLAVSPGLGYKFDPGNPGGFFVEPGILIPVTIGKRDFSSWGYYKGPNDMGVSVGFVLYCGLGWAF